MDATLKGYVDTILQNNIEYFLKANGVGGVPSGAFVLTYGGALFAFFASVAGAYNCGATLITTLEADLFSWIDEYQGDQNTDYTTLFQEIMEEGDGDELMQYFLTYYAADVLILTAVVFWHISFLITMGLVTAVLILFSADGKKLLIKYSNGAYGAAGDVATFKAWKFFLFGVLQGVVNYLAALAVSENQETVMQMIGFSGHSDDDTTVTQSTSTNAGGVTTI